MIARGACRRFSVNREEAGAGSPGVNHEETQHASSKLSRDNHGSERRTGSSRLSAPNPARSASPNDTIRVAVIGPGGRGTQLLKEGSAHETGKIVR